MPANVSGHSTYPAGHPNDGEPQAAPGPLAEIGHARNRNHLMPRPTLLQPAFQAVPCQLPAVDQSDQRRRLLPGCRRVVARAGRGPRIV